MGMYVCVYKILRIVQHITQQKFIRGGNTNKCYSTRILLNSVEFC